MSAKNDPFYNQFFKNNADEKIQYDENGNPISPAPPSKGLGTVMPGVESMAVKQAVTGDSLAGVVGSVAPYAAAAAGTYLAGQSLYNTSQGKEDNSTEGKAGRAQAAITTGGLSELAKASGVFTPSTKDLEAKTWQGVADSKDPANAAYGKQYQDYLNSPQAAIDAQGPNTFDAKKAAGTLKAEDVWGGAGLVNDIPGWLTKYSEGQRRDVSQQFINQNLITSDHGDLQLTDVDKANSLAEGALASKTPTGAPLASAAPPGLLGPVTQLDPAIQGQIAEMQKQTKLSQIQPYLRPGNANFNFKGF